MAVAADNTIDVPGADVLLGELLNSWWRQPDHYAWLLAYLQERGVKRWFQLLTAATTGALGILPCAVVWTSDPPAGLVARIVVAIIAAWCVTAALLWLIRWPTRTQSAVFVVVSTLCIAAIPLCEPDPLIGLISCTAFAPLGGYIAFFHSARYMVFIMAVAGLTVTTLAIQVVAAGHLILAVDKVLLVMAVITAVPLTAQILVHLLGTDLEVSDTDPLTGLLNRRALKRAVLDLLSLADGGPAPHCPVVVAMIDLDNFKQLNDSHGHAAGDRALVAVGSLIRQNSRNSAVVARVGGEEFVVIDVLSEGDADAMAEGIRASIAASPYQVTASLGTASTRLDGHTPLDGVYVVEELLTVADDAMYEAKRAGGDQVRHRRDVAGSDSLAD